MLRPELCGAHAGYSGACGDLASWPQSSRSACPAGNVLSGYPQGWGLPLCTPLESYRASLATPWALPPQDGVSPSVATSLSTLRCQSEPRGCLILPKRQGLWSWQWPFAPESVGQEHVAGDRFHPDTLGTCVCLRSEAAPKCLAMPLNPRSLGRGLCPPEAAGCRAARLASAPAAGSPHPPWQ